MARGHHVTIFCRRHEGRLGDVTIVELPNRALTNHGRTARFARDLAAATRDNFDCIAGFNAMPGLDVLYCADAPVRGASSMIDRINPRVRALNVLEASCFGPDSRTRLLLLAEPQRADYDRIWQMNAERVTVLPPTIERARAQPHLRSGEARAEMRARLGLTPSSLGWLFVAGFPQTKGLDRIIDALPRFPRAKMVCVGFTPEAHPQLIPLGLRNDIPALMAAADLLVHPSRRDITGTVILEAMANGLPVITTSLCGYAQHVATADAGIVLPEPFTQAAFVQALQDANDANTRSRWSGNALEYSASHDLTSGLDRAADEIERASLR